MKISYNWLQEYFEKELPNPKDLADLLNIRAFEVEEIEEKEGDSILDIKVTPDRAPDCLSHEGVAREVAVHVNQKSTPQTTSDIADDFQTDVTVSLSEEKAVRYMFREIQNVVVGESSLEIKKKLEAIGQRTINTVVDITNLVMYEIGQPMHAFDSDKLSGKKITITSPKHTTFKTLDNKEVELTEEDATIQDGEDDLAIAGVKGGKKGEVTSETKNIILESANFFPTKVRKTSKNTGIQTDSSKRFENGLSPELAERALVLASHYIKRYASTDETKFSNIVDVYPRPSHPYHTGVTLEHINTKLGLHLSQQEVEKIFERINFSYTYQKTKQVAIEEIKKLLDVPHKIGASLTYDAPQSFDCSSLIAYVYAIGGLSIPRMTVDQLFFGREITEEELEPGDLIFSVGSQGAVHTQSKEFIPGTPFVQGVDHVGMYIGDGNVIHSSRYTDKTVIEKVSDASCFKTIVGYRRMVTSDEMRFAIMVPHVRLDIRGEMDIIEEIGRTYGYEHIVPVAPTLTSGTKSISLYEKIRTIKSHLIDMNIDEVITYTFGKKGDIAVVKPLAKDKQYLRTNLTKGVTEALELNFKNRELHASESVSIFEIGNVFNTDGEHTMLAIGFKSASKKQKSKQVLEEIIKTLSEKIKVELPVQIVEGQEVVEINISEISNTIQEIYNSLYVLEKKPYKTFSPYPFMTRDLAVWADDIKTKTDIEKIITEKGTSLLLRYDLFDEFSKEGKTSYAYRIVFQSFEKTLTDDEINLIMENIYSTLQAESGFEIR
jgi:phenylalanyl-tRNA synthetase beta subunit